MSIHDMRDTLHNLLPPQKTIDYCFLEVATQWELFTEDYVMGVAHHELLNCSVKKFATCS